MERKLLDAQRLSAGALAGVRCADPRAAADRRHPLAAVPLLLRAAEIDRRRQGQPVNALLGTINALLSLIDAPARALTVRGVAACLGAEEATYRVALYAAYHAQREPMPPALAGQWEKAPALLAAMGWTVSASEALEADDVMFSHALLEQEAGGRALLLTGDRDLYAAVGEHVAVVELARAAPTARSVPSRCASATASSPRRSRLHRAARRSLGRAARCAGHRGQDGGRAAAPPRHARGRCSPPRPAAPMRRCARARVAALCENDSLLRTFKEVATLQRIDLPRPPIATRTSRAARWRPRELGMRRLCRAPVEAGRRAAGGLRA